MPSAFVRTLRSLEVDSYRPAFVLGGISVPLLAAWAIWGLVVKTPVHAVTTQARTEVQGNVVPVDVSVQGRVLASKLELSRHVEAGEVLLQLDATMDRAQLAELRVKVEATRKRLAPLRDQQSALERVLGAQQRVGSATVAVAAARVASANREATTGEELAAINRRLSKEGLGSKLDELESAMAPQRRKDSAREGSAELSRTAAGQALEAQRLALQSVELGRQIVEVEAELAQGEASLKTLELQIEQRTIRALVSGYLGDVAPITVGTTVTPGKPLATIIPEGKLHLIALYAPTEAVGRVARGQRAYVRFMAFPWTQFGIAEGDVVSVGVEPQQGGVRVEIEMDRSTTARIPLQHGMPASVEIRVDEATPWQMLLRTLGGYM